MSITDELRKWGYGFCGDTHDVVTAIADRIDEQCERELTMARGEAVQHLGSEVAKKYVKLPVDADGEPIHLQDRMSWDNGTFNVHELKLTADGWTTWDELRPCPMCGSTDPSSQMPNYCPNCGRAVVDA